MKSTESQQVTWWAVHEFIAPALSQVSDWPTLGTPAWCNLVRTDPRKWCALLDGAQHWALRLESCQDAPPKAISTAVDWKSVRQEIQRRHKAVADGVYIPRVVAR
jgi:hypothetical protein